MLHHSLPLVKDGGVLGYWNLDLTSGMHELAQQNWDLFQRIGSVVAEIGGLYKDAERSRSDCDDQVSQRYPTCCRWEILPPQENQWARVRRNSAVIIISNTRDRRRQLRKNT